MLEIDQIDVSIEDTPILRQADLTVGNGEVVGLLGPSGSGKSTLLRAVAGLVDVASGDIRWDGASLLDVPTHRRGLGLMFQGYALFPHLDVAQNVGFGLRMQRNATPGPLISEALEMVGLAGYENREVDSLSGGEKQRVALARTLAPQPRFVMLDEPLGALDRNLRRMLMTEMREILTEREVTGIVVTHDRDEAVAMADRLALMREGTIVQTGTLSEILDRPANDWVRAFVS
ncbi:MAG: ABC transporter ATP-binding protein [Acidimicrobiia bacterium]|nr:ABC transporter ATP-binding protein [Acidimicrobiia bacterium]